MYRTNGNLKSRTAGMARIRRHRRGDATFIAIAALVAILFVSQVGWVVAQQPDPQIGVARR
jgi:hypothetical protein